MKDSRQLKTRYLMMVSTQNSVHAAGRAMIGKVRKAAFVVAFFALSTYSVAQTGSQDCQCRAPGGEMRDLGSVECVDVVGTRYLVVCVMSTNTPYWKRIDHSDGCPVA